MEKTIKKSISISAPKEKVWDILTNDKFTRIWYAEFSAGSHAETDWKVGSKAVFIDTNKSGMVGKVIASKPGEVLSVEYEGLINAGIEDYESEDAKQVKGGRETYLLSEKDGITNLSIESGMTEQYFESMSLAWDKALQKIKDLSEGKEKSRSASQ
ncbi:MAG: SRPBCC domain-containing protein [Bacteroidota bacterium]